MKRLGHAATALAVPRYEIVAWPLDGSFVAAAPPLHTLGRTTPNARCCGNDAGFLRTANLNPFKSISARPPLHLEESRWRRFRSRKIAGKVRAFFDFYRQRSSRCTFAEAKDSSCSLQDDETNHCADHEVGPSRTSPVHESTGSNDTNIGDNVVG